MTRPAKTAIIVDNSGLAYILLNFFCINEGHWGLSISTFHFNLTGSIGGKQIYTRQCHRGEENGQRLALTTVDINYSHRIVRPSSQTKETPGFKHGRCYLECPCSSHSAIVWPALMTWPPPSLSGWTFNSVRQTLTDLFMLVTPTNGYTTQFHGQR